MYSPSRQSDTSGGWHSTRCWRPWTGLAAALGLAALVLGATFALLGGEATAQTERPPSLVLIEEARQSGAIDDETALLYKAYSVFAPERLPPAYQSDASSKSGTMVFVELARSWDDLTPETRRRLSEFVAGPGPRDSASDLAAAQDRPTLDDELTFTTTHFVVHYTITGTDKVYQPTVDVDPVNGVPDYVDWVAEDLETVWEAQLTTMGWLEPPADAGEGGDTRYDVYLKNMSYYGYTAFDNDSMVGDNPNSPTVTETQAYYSYMGLENNLSPDPQGATRRGMIQATLAHEYNHAIQVGYDGGEAIWLMEATATWMEDEVYDEINDNYQFLGQLFEKPDIALDVHDGETWAYGYGRFVFPRYIAEHHGGQATVRTIWENAVVSDSLDAVEGALVAAGTSFSELFPRFVAANYVLSPQPYNEPHTYEEADGYRAEVGGMEIEAYLPFTGTTVTYDSFGDGNGHNLERHSAEYWVFDATTGFTATFNGNAGTEYVVQGALRQSDRVVITQISLLNQEGTFVVYDPSAYDEVLIIVANVGDTDEEGSYTLNLVATTETPPTATFAVDPISGTFTAEFTFDASASADDQTSTEDLEVRWDWEGDYAWDTEWSLTKTATHTFGLPGAYSVTLEVRDEVGLRGTTTRLVTAAGRSVFLPLALR